jgi:hypothetical protein
MASDCRWLVQALPRLRLFVRSHNVYVIDVGLPVKSEDRL